MSHWIQSSDPDETTDCDAQQEPRIPHKNRAIRALVSKGVSVGYLLVVLTGLRGWFGWPGEIVSALGWRLSLIGMFVFGGQVALRHRWPSRITIAASLVALIPGTLLSPRLTRASSSSPGLHLRVLVANVHALNDQTDNLTTMLARTDADVLVLTEPPPALMKELRPEGSLASVFPNISRSKPDPRAHSWLVVASRLDLMKQPGTRPGLNPVNIVVGDQQVALIATHLTSPRSAGRSRAARVEVNALAAAVQNQNRPGHYTMIAGDLNAPPDSVRSRRISRLTGMKRAKPRFRVAGTWPAHLPSALSLPIDGVFGTPGIGVAGWNTVALPGSDHRAVLVDLVIPGTSSEGLSRE